MNLFHRLSRITRDSFFYLFLASILCLPLDAQFKFREPPNRQDPLALDPEGGENLWQWFLSNRSIGAFAMQGELLYRPAGAPSTGYDFLLEAEWSQGCERTSLRIRDGDRVLFSREVVSDGKETRVSNNRDDSAPQAIDWHEPLLEQLPFTWFDLLMPYLQWKAVTYVGPERYLGRPAHQYRLSNPDADASPTTVLVTLDEDYAAVLKVSLLGQDDNVLKRMRVGGFKKFGDNWMISDLNWEDRSDRSSVKLSVYSFTNTSPSGTAG